MKMFRSMAFAFMILLIARSSGKAQGLDLSISRSFNASIVARVYDVEHRVRLGIGEQTALAAGFQKQDSTLAAWLSQGRPDQEIDSLSNSTTAILIRVLSKEQLKTYFENKAGAFSSMAAAGELAYIDQEYKPDSAESRSMMQRIRAKYDMLFQNCMIGQLNPEMGRKLVAMTNRGYDYYAFYPSLYRTRYVNEYLQKLTAIRSIPETELENIRKGFYGSIYADKYIDWGMAMNNATKYSFPDTAIFSKLFHREFEQEAYELSEADAYNLIYRERVSRNAYDSIYELVKEKNYAKAVLQFTYSYYHNKTFDTLLRNTAQHYDSAIEAALLRDGDLQPVTQFAIALKYKDLLHIRGSLTDTLLDYAMILAKRRDSILYTDPFAVIDFGPYEAGHLSQLLSEDQYTQLLYYKNNALSAFDAESDWKEMELRALTGTYNKEMTIAQIKSYYLSKYCAWNRFAYDKIQQWAAVHALEETKPEALKILDPVRWSGTAQKPTNNLKLQW